MTIFFNHNTSKAYDMRMCEFGRFSGDFLKCPQWQSLLTEQFVLTSPHSQQWRVLHLITLQMAPPGRVNTHFHWQSCANCSEVVLTIKAKHQGTISRLFFVLVTYFVFTNHDLCTHHTHCHTAQFASWWSATASCCAWAAQRHVINEGHTYTVCLHTWLNSDSCADELITIKILAAQ